MSLGSSHWVLDSILWVLPFSWKRARFCSWVVFSTCFLPEEFWGSTDPFSFCILSFQSRGEVILLMWLSQKLCRPPKHLIHVHSIRQNLPILISLRVPFYVGFLGRRLSGNDLNLSEDFIVWLRESVWNRLNLFKGLYVSV